MFLGSEDTSFSFFLILALKKKYIKGKLNGTPPLTYFFLQGIVYKQGKMPYCDKNVTMV